MKAHPAIDAYLKNITIWREEMQTLRAILLACGLTEELKWGKPCYTFQESNVAIIQGFKTNCALLFCKGALLADPEGLLRKPGEHTQAARRLEFTTVEEIAGMEGVVKRFVRDAIAAEKAGLEVEFKSGPEPIPAELQEKFNEMPALRTAFHALTPGRQRAYILHFSGAKQSQTRTARIEKNIPQILEGKGFNER